MSKKQFFLYKIFNEKRMVTISDAAIARIYGVPEKNIREYVRQDTEAGMIIEVRFRSTYYLTFLGLHTFYRHYTDCVWYISDGEYNQKILHTEDIFPVWLDFKLNY